MGSGKIPGSPSTMPNRTSLIFPSRAERQFRAREAVNGACGTVFPTRTRSMERRSIRADVLAMDIMLLVVAVLLLGALLLGSLRRTLGIPAIVFYGALVALLVRRRTGRAGIGNH